jgi:hypothetical protein
LIRRGSPKTPFVRGEQIERALFEEIDMEDFPIWLKLVIWGTIGLTVLYTIWGMLHSYLQA